MNASFLAITLTLVISINTISIVKAIEDVDTPLSLNERYYDLIRDLEYTDESGSQENYRLLVQSIRSLIYQSLLNIPEHEIENVEYDREKALVRYVYGAIGGELDWLLRNKHKGSIDEIEARDLGVERLQRLLRIFPVAISESEANSEDGEVLSYLAGFIVLIEDRKIFITTLKDALNHTPKHRQAPLKGVLRFFGEVEEDSLARFSGERILEFERLFSRFYERARQNYEKGIIGLPMGIQESFLFDDPTGGLEESGIPQAIEGSKYDRFEVVPSSNDDLNILQESWNAIYIDMFALPTEERRELYANLLNVANSMVISLALFPGGGYDLDRGSHDEVMIELLERIFSGEQAALKRAASKDDERDEALDIMKERARSFMAMYPIMDIKAKDAQSGQAEIIVLSIYLARAYNYIPEEITELAKKKLPRWEREQRVPGLLVLAESGDDRAREELETYDSETIRDAKSTFRHIVGRGETRP